MFTEKTGFATPFLNQRIWDGVSNLSPRHMFVWNTAYQGMKK